MHISTRIMGTFFTHMAQNYLHDMCINVWIGVRTIYNIWVSTEKKKTRTKIVHE